MGAGAVFSAVLPYVIAGGMVVTIIVGVGALTAIILALAGVIKVGDDPTLVYLPTIE